ncbi:MAG: hypothetical protein ACRDOL_07330 [Streptosporangiaceae bacterium]
MSKSNPEATVSRYFEAYQAGNSPFLRYLMRRRSRSLGALVSLCRLPCLRAVPSAGVEGAAIRAKLRRNSSLWRLTGLATAVLRLPEEPGAYVLGASKQTLRRKIRLANRLGISWEEVEDEQERRDLLKLANSCERSHPDATYRIPVPGNDDLLDYRLWLVARAADGRPLLLSVTPVDGELAMLRYFRTLGWGEDQSQARYFMTEVLVERLVSLGVRYLIDGSNLFWLPNGVRHFQQMTGFHIVRVRVGRLRRRALPAT